MKKAATVGGAPLIEGKTEIIERGLNIALREQTSGLSGQRREDRAGAYLW